MTRKANGKNLKTGESFRSDGRYMYRYTTASGKRKTIYAPDLKELRKKEKELLVKEELGLVPQGDQITVAEQFENYIDSKHYAHTTNKTAHDHLNFLKHFDFASLPLASVTRQKCAAFVVEFNQRYAATTTRCMISYLKEAFSMAVADHIILSNPLDYNFYSLIKENVNPPRKGLTNQEFDLFIQFMKKKKSWLVPHTIFLRETGLRLSEFIALTYSDIDFHNHCVNIDKQIKLKFDKKNKKTIFYIKKPKTQKSIAKVPMSPIAEEAIKEIMGRCKESKSLDGYEGFFVLNRNGTNFILSASIDRAYLLLTKSYNKSHMIPIKVTPHILRHTTPAYLLGKGVDALTVQRIMRHSAMSTTIDTYTHLDDETIVSNLRAAYAPKPKGEI